MLQVPRWMARLHGEVLAREALPALEPAWQGLSGRALEDNVYYSPRYARALMDHVDRDPGLRFAAVWDGDSLVAFLPFKRSAVESPLLGTAARAWQTDYTFSCMPLLDQTCATEAAEALVALLRTINQGEWIVPALNAHGAAAQAMTGALERQGRPWRFANAFQRASIETDMHFDEYMQTHVSSKRRRDLARNRRRLEAVGEVAYDNCRSGEKLTHAVEAFLAIEASGWKGRRGTALACHPQTAQFARDAFGGDAGSICRADVLTLNDAPIAVSLTACAGNTGFTVKCAYDENYRNYSAGLLLEVEVLRSFFTDRWAGRLDAATNGAHVIDSLWSGRYEVSDLYFTFAPRRAGSRLSTLAEVIDAKKRAKNALKSLVAPLRAK